MNPTALLLPVILTALAFAAPAANARDTVLHLPLQKAIDAGKSNGKLDGSVQFFLAGPNTPAASRIEEVVSNRKTNALNKSDEEACLWAMQSALIALQQAAKKSGANAVVDLVSWYKRSEYSSPTDYECHAGGTVAGVTLKGQIARIK